jgi:hypothetical protein
LRERRLAEIGGKTSNEFKIVAVTDNGFHFVVRQKKIELDGRNYS